MCSWDAWLRPWSNRIQRRRIQGKDFDVDFWNVAIISDFFSSVSFFPPLFFYTCTTGLVLDLKSFSLRTWLAQLAARLSTKKKDGLRTALPNPAECRRGLVAQPFLAAAAPTR